MSELTGHIAQSIRARKLFRRGEKILVAVSGGVDSMVLLDLLHALATENRWSLVVAHFNHQLRGRASDADERLVRATAKKLRLPCAVSRGDVKAAATRRGISIEMAARELRHAFLAATARRLKIKSIALAHHADDQVELFFLRLLRGAGGEGLAGMRWISPSPADAARRLVRPLRGVSKTELETFGRENKIQFRTDASNASPDILRNRIRHELLPLLRRRFQPALDATVLRAMEIIGTESDLVGGIADGWAKHGKGFPFSELAVALQRRIVQSQILRLGVAPDFELVEKLRACPGVAVSVGAGESVVCDAAGRAQKRKAVRAKFSGRNARVSLRGAGGEGRFGPVHFRWRAAAVGGAKLPKPDARREFFDADKVGGRIVLRHWRAGDRFQPIGMKSAVKLQDWFVNQKIPRAKRHQLVVAEAECGEIFWVEGERISESFKLTAATLRRLEWNWTRGKSRVAARGGAC